MLFIRELKRVWDTGLWIYNNGTINSASKPRKVSMPKEGALLLNQCELISESLARLNGTLGNV